MFHPVDPETFYETAAGQDFLTQFVEPDNDRFRILTERVFRAIPGEFIEGQPVKQEVIELSPPERTANRLAKYANWLNANFDPDTGRCKLYRLVDDRCVDSFQSHGAITSRVVEAFGVHDIDLAIGSLESTAHGHTPKHVQSFIEARLAPSDIHIRELAEGYQYWEEFLRPHHDEVERLLSHQISPEASQKLLEKAALLKTTQGLGAAAYIAACHESANDDVPSGPLLSIRDLTHSSIHLTSDPYFIHYLAKSWAHNCVLELNYVPGSLPLGLQLGYIDGRYLTHPMMGGGDYEWYGVGQLALQNGLVEISVRSLADIPEQATTSD